MRSSHGVTLTPHPDWSRDCNWLYIERCAACGHCGHQQSPIDDHVWCFVRGCNCNGEHCDGSVQDVLPIDGGDA